MAAESDQMWWLKVRNKTDFHETGKVLFWRHAAEQIRWIDLFVLKRWLVFAEEKDEGKVKVI